MPLGDILLGRRLGNSEDHEQKIGPTTGFPLLGIDALSSTAYGTEAALFVLMWVGMVGFSVLMPITWVIIAVMTIVMLSYLQTVVAYPNGGGSYTVATDNLGRKPGLIAGSALLLDYILVVAIGSSAGVGALVSAFPHLQPYLVPMSLALVLMMTIINLRGVKESGAAFAIPVYGYIVILLGIIALGIFKTVQAGGNPVPLVPPEHIHKTTQTIGWLLLLKAFSNGCAALTGIEAVANGVPLFRDPASKNAQRVLIMVVGVMALIFAGLAFLANAYKTPAMSAEEGNYRTVLSQIVAAVVGNGPAYYIFLFFLLALMALSANTAYAGFPRMCRLLARDDYLPHAFAARGRRLVFHYGIWVLTGFACLLIIAFGGLLERLLPLYAVGVFVAFTLSQFGMVKHWNRHPEELAQKRFPWLPRTINFVGGVVTGLATLVILYTKFQQGAWLALIMVPGFVVLFLAIKRHYIEVNRMTSAHHSIDTENLEPPLIIVPVQRWSSMTEHAIQFSVTLSPDVEAIHIADGEDDESIMYLHRDWNQFVVEPLEAIGKKAPELIVVPSPYRHIIRLILDYVRAKRKTHPGRRIMVVVPELVEAKWYQYFLHNQRAQALKAALLLQGQQDIMVLNVPWYMHPERRAKEAGAADSRRDRLTGL